MENLDNIQNGEVMSSVREKINGNFNSIKQAVDSLESSSVGTVLYTAPTVKGVNGNLNFNTTNNKYKTLEIYYGCARYGVTTSVSTPTYIENVCIGSTKVALDNSFTLSNATLSTFWYQYYDANLTPFDVILYKELNISSTGITVGSQRNLTFNPVNGSWHRENPSDRCSIYIYKVVGYEN